MEKALFRESDGVAIDDLIVEYRQKLPSCSPGVMAREMRDDPRIAPGFRDSAVLRDLTRRIGQHFRESEADGTPRRIHTGERDDGGLIQIEFAFAERDHGIEDCVVRAMNIEAGARALAERIAQFSKRWRGFPSIDDVMEMARERMNGASLNDAEAEE